MNENILKLAYELYIKNVDERRKIKPIKIIGKLSFGYFCKHKNIFNDYIKKAINIDRINKIKKINE